jgi:hypothetical protein
MAATAKLIVPALLFFCGSQDIAAQSSRSGPDVPRFMGRVITVTAGELEDSAPGDGPPFPKGPASVCIEGPPYRQCYAAPASGNFPFGNNPAVTVVQLKKDLPAILFSAETGGVSGWEIHLALLRPGTGNTLESLFVPDISVSSQSEYAFWSDSAISATQIFVTADYVWGPDEGHFGEHRYMISTYTRPTTAFDNDLHYWLADRYMTLDKYGSESNINVLIPEKQEIIARLRRIRAAPQHSPR